MNSTAAEAPRLRYRDDVKYRCLLLLPACCSVALALATGCVPQSEECAIYVECQAAYDEAFNIAPAQGGVDTSRWKPGGVCWASLPAAADCTEDCATATAELRAAATSADVDLAACTGG